MQDTRVYDYMVRSGTVQCVWAGVEKTIPVSIGVAPRRKENDLSIYCTLSSPNGGLRVEVFIENDTGLPVEIRSFSLETTILLPENTQVFCNGYQSWSYSPMVEVSRGLPRQSRHQPSLLRNSGDTAFTSYANQQAHSWSYTYFNAPIGFTLLASLDESAAYTKYKFSYDTSKAGSSVLVEKDCEGFFLTPVPRTSGVEIPPVKILDFFMTTGPEQDCFSRYFDLFYQSNSGSGRFNRSMPALAWDSWYAMYNQPEELRILSVLNEYKVREIPLDYFIIGQGYENKVGDWTTLSRQFSGGMSRVVKAVREAGYKPGLTFSPFICSSSSLLYSERRELLARDRNEQLICVGRNREMGGRLYLLDLYNVEAQKLIRRTIRTMIEEWGIQILKMDFLYAAGLHSGSYVKRTRAQAVNHALGLVRDAAGSVPVIACGVPLGSAIGIVEYCSVAPDLSPEWDGPVSLFTCKSIRERESTRSAVISTIGRRHLDGRAFSCDPGSFTLRKFKNRLRPSEQESLYKTCIIFGGLISNSDSIGSYSADALDQYRVALAHKATRFNHKRVLSIERTDHSVKVKYALRNELREDLIDLHS